MAPAPSRSYHRLFLSAILICILFFLVNTASARAQTSVSGSISTDTTWNTAGSPYILNCHVTVDTDVVLTIEPGVVVKGRDSSCDMVVKGFLKADGVIFTSWNDPDHGGDTNGPGTDTPATPGDWHGIYFQDGGNTRPESSFLGNSSVLYGGNPTGFKGSLAFSGNGAPVSISGLTVSYSYNDGLHIYSGATAPFVSGSTFSLNGDDGLESAAPFSTLSGNIFSDNGDKALVIPAIIGGGVTDNSYSDNTGINGMYLTGDITADTNWPASNSPYVPAGTPDILTIDAGVTLNIESGSIIKFPACLNGSSHACTGHGIKVLGSLNASGTVFTSFFDDTHGDDTNGDHDATRAEPGDWYNIEFAGGGGILSGCTLLYGGSQPNHRDRGEIFINDSSPQLTGNTITDSMSSGIYVYSGDPAIDGNVISENGGNGISTDGGPISVLAGNSFINNTGFAVKLPATIGPGVHDNSYEGNDINGMYLTGHIDQSTAWAASNSPYIIEGEAGLFGPSYFDIDANTTLSISSGTVVKMMAGEDNATHVNTDRVFRVKGTLQADGAVFTSYFDDDYGGDANGDDHATFAAPGDWYFVVFNQNSGGYLRNSSIRYGGGGASEAQLLIESSSVEISNTVIDHSHSRGVKVTAGSTTVTGNTISDNALEGLEADAPPAVFSGNSFTGNGSVAARIPATTGNGVFSNNFSGNGVDALFLTGDVTSDSHWPGSSGPYVLENDTAVDSGTTLSVENGAVVKFRAGLDGSGNHTGTNRSLIVYGTLNASGAVFTSWFDNEYGGDTDGTDSAPEAGDWGSITLNDGSIVDTQVRYGGGGIEGGEGELRFSGGGNYILDSSEITNSFSRGLYIFSGTPSVTGCTFADNGEAGLQSDVNLSMTGNVFSGNGGEAARIPATTGTGVSDNILTGNGKDALYLTGDVIADSIWPASNSTYVLVGETGYYGPAYTDVAEGVVLTVEPGAVVKFLAELSGIEHVNTDHVLSVRGTLDADGAVFTSFFDNDHGGSTSGGQGLSEPMPGDWSRIHFYNTATGNISNTISLMVAVIRNRNG